MVETAHRRSDSPYIARVWRGDSGHEGQMTSVANSHWELVVWSHNGVTHGAIRGPETRAATAPVPAESTSLGISFSHGAFIPRLDMSRLVDSELRIRLTVSGDPVIGGLRLPSPRFDDAEDFVSRLVRAGMIARDPLVGEIIAGERPPISARSAQRRVSAATGIPRGAVRQIERARHAAVLLREGGSPCEVVHRLGYYDHAHLNRSLARFIGRTPTRLRDDEHDQPLSLLYKPTD